MKVIYDISPVGSLPQTRTGLARVAWSTGFFLNQQLGDNLSFSACGSIWAAIEAEKLLVTHPQFLSSMNRVSVFAKQLCQVEADLSGIKYQSKGVSQIVLNIAQMSVKNLARILNVTRIPVNKKSLLKTDIFHSSYARIPYQVRQTIPGRHVLTVHDLTPLVLEPHYFAPGQLGITRRIIDSIQSDDWIIAVSESTRNDLCNRRSVNPERVVVIQNAASREIFYPVNDADTIQKVQQKYKIPNALYLLSLHSLAPHKNLNYLVQCFRKLIHQERINDIYLVVCGGQTESVKKVIKDLNLSNEERHQVHFTGYVEEEDLAALYSGARGFIFPSLYEGFGLPVLEAMQCGCPVISSNTSSLPEVVGEAGLLISPNDEDTLCQAMLKIYKDVNLCRELSTRAKKRASLFSWEETVNQTLNLYRRILNYQ